MAQQWVADLGSGQLGSRPVSAPTSLRRMLAMARALARLRRGARCLARLRPLQASPGSTHCSWF